MILNKVFNSYKIRYKDITRLLSSEGITIDKGSKINVYINLDSVIRDLCKSNVEKELRSSRDRKDLTFCLMSNILNLISHYRDYFTKSGIYSRVIIYTTLPFNRLRLKSFYIKNYKKNLFNKINSSDAYMVRTLFEEAIPTCKTICEFIEDCHIVTTNHFDSSLIPYICERNHTESESHSFIVTKDKYDFQYANHNSIILRPKKDNHYIVHKDNLMDVLKNDHRVTNKNTVDSTFLPFIFSILGDESRNLPKIKRVGLSAIINMLIEAQEYGVIGKENMSIYILAKTLNNEYKEVVLGNYSSIDLYSQYGFLNKSDIHDITSQLVNRFDNMSLQILNDNYFCDHPINIMELVNASIDYKNHGFSTHQTSVFKMKKG